VKTCLNYNIKMEKQISHIDDLIIRFLAGETTAEELRELREWRAESAENEASFSRRRELWASSLSAEQLARFDGSKAFAAFMKRKSQAERAPRVRTLRLFKYAAAAVLLLVAVSYGAYNTGRSGVTRTFADIVIEAPKGSNTVTTLPDGTVVTLNAGSRLAYSQGYGVQNRRVSFSGEAYFDVKKHSSLPFTIETASLIVEDIGTKFNFSDYEDDNIAFLNLEEGKVAMQDRERILPKQTLNPNQTAYFNKADGRLTIRDTGSKKSHEWAQGRLVFNGEPFARVEKVLERAYNIDITVTEESVYRLRFHGEFSSGNDRIEDVLASLAKTGKLKYRVNGRHITIY